ncbi:NADH-quinone oxidoreductase subunit NuoN [Nocardioides yefusunii]|uniref:NADH-quinone oxidoreductase subunit N n=1 Tax=Nocardioides yefusunii TaxID=2500546 RepID=A0ABW1QX53_9ACTN|nr:NADH-quinone oxidoreductase subunit NuoN [Nocardioides yefusunii]
MNDVAEFAKPSLEYGHLSPLLIVLAGAFLAVLVEAFVPRPRRFLVQTLLTAVVLVAAIVATLAVSLDLPEASGVDVSGLSASGVVGAMGSLALDGPTFYLWGLLLVLALLGTALFADRSVGGLSSFAGQAAVAPQDEHDQPAARARWEQTEVYPLLLFAVAGGLLLVAAHDLLVLFIAVEILSLPLYLLCATARRHRLLSQEAALKYFLLGAFASAFLLMGIAFTYGIAGSTTYDAVAVAVAGEGEAGAPDRVLLLAAIGLLLVGLGFKVGVAPFHAWTPDVYQGAPSPLVAWMAAATKVAAFAALTRLLLSAFGSVRDDWTPAVAALALVSMVVGTLFALTQDDVKRLLAYSSVAHAGFLMVGLLGKPSNEADSTGLGVTTAVLIYLTAYALTTVGAFAVVSTVRESGADGAAGAEATSLQSWRGLGRRAPWTAAAFGFLVLALAGIPLTSGFVGKWAVFETAASDGHWVVVVVAVLTSGVAAAFYVRVIGQMFFAEPLPVAVVRETAGTDIGGGGDTSVSVATRPVVTQGTEVTVLPMTWLTGSVIVVAAAATLVLGVLPDPLVDLVGRAGEWIR